MRIHLVVSIALALTQSATAQPDPTPAPAPTPTPAPPTPEPTPTVDPVVAAEPPKEDKKSGTAGFDKGFFVKNADGNYSMKITGRVQSFYNLTINDTIDPMAMDTQPADWKNQFEIRRARLILEGNIHTKKLLYKMQSDFGKGFVTLKDFHGDIEVGKDTWLRFGQWKRPFSRQQINSSGRLEITDRSITDKAFGAGRDIGIAIRNDYEKSPELEWTVGVFNGTGDGAASTVTITPPTDPTMPPTGTTTLPTNVPPKFKPAIVGRVGINKNGLKGYTEGDLEGGGLRWGVAGSVWLEGDYDDDLKSNQKIEVDYIVKNDGLSSTGGLYLMTDQNGDKVIDAETSLIGFHLQLGYMLVPRRWQVAGRYALVNDPRSADPQPKDQQEISLGANYYQFAHDAKLAGAIRLIKNPGANNANAEWGDALLIEIGANIGF